MHIQDHGYGISPDDQERLFTLFGTLDATRDANANGIGIGLNICKKIVKNAKGQIDCFSRGRNMGSIFMFSMRMTLPKQYVNGLSVI